MKTKGEHVNAALRDLRISGITVLPTGDELADALSVLEDMMNELSCTINTDWNQEDSPSGGSDSGIDPKFNAAVSSNLAIRLVDMYGKQVTPTLSGTARASLLNWRRATSKVNPTIQPNTMPTGSGNRLYGLDYDNYFDVEKAPTANSKTEYATKGDTVEHTTYFNYDAIATVTVSAIDGATVNSQTIDGNKVTLNITFAKSGYFTFTIVATDDAATNPIVTAKKLTYVVGE